MDFDAYRLTQMVAAITLPLVSTRKSDKNMENIFENTENQTAVLQLAHVTGEKTTHVSAALAKKKPKKELANLKTQNMANVVTNARQTFFW